MMDENDSGASWFPDFTIYVAEPDNYVEIDATSAAPANQSQVNNDSTAAAEGWSFASFNNFLGNVFGTINNTIRNVQGVNTQMNGAQATNSAGAVTSTAPLIRTPAQIQNDKLMQALIIGGLVYIVFKG